MASLHKNSTNNSCLTVWRLVTHKFISSAFSGEGARFYGGRWNKKGTLMVYTAATQSLAMLEMLVQDEPLRANYAIIPAYIPTHISTTCITLNELQAMKEDSQSIGTTWVKSEVTAVLAVPSAVIPAENNYLLNPTHPDFTKIIIGQAEVFPTDVRLFRAHSM